MQGDKFALTTDWKKAIEESLPKIISGLTKLPNLDLDNFLKRKLKEIFVIYLPKFQAKFHPLLCIFNDYLDSNAKVTVQKLILEVMTGDFLKLRSTSSKTSNFLTVLTFLELAIKAAGDAENSKICIDLICQEVFSTIASIYLRNDSTFEVKNQLKETLKALLIKSQKQDPNSRILRREMNSLIGKDFAFNAKEMLSFLQMCGVFHKRLVANQLDLLTSQLIMLEEKRGVERILALRSEMEKLTRIVKTP